MFGGGGSKGSYAIGVCKALREAGKSFDIVTGTSIGAIVGALYTQGDEQNLTSWMTGFSQDLVSKNLFEYPNRYKTESLNSQQSARFLSMFCKDGPDAEPLKKRILDVFDWQKFQDSPIEYACLTANISQKRSQAFTKDDMPEDLAADILMASAAYFPAFNFVKIHQDYYADGGYYNVIPWRLCEHLGAESLTIISLQDPGEKASLPCDHVELLIRPLLKPYYYLDFQSDHMLKQIGLGYLEGLKYLNLAPGYLYTFYPDDWKDIQDLEDKAASILGNRAREITLEVIQDMDSALLGYRPWPLDNKYSDHYKFTRILEALALSAGLPVYTRYHFHDFIRQLLEKLKDFDIDLNIPASGKLYQDMEKAGLKDLIAFFHSALISFHETLPVDFEIIKDNFPLPYYLSMAWYLLETYAATLDL